MVKPDAYVLSGVPWHFFGSLTYKGKVPTQRQRNDMWFAFIFATARMWRVKPSKLSWVLREEQGEQFGRTHQHFLMLASDQRQSNPTTCFIMMDKWEALGGGMARIRPYNSSLAGADYVVKCLGGGDSYEMGKFNAETSALTLSHRLQILLERKSRYTRLWRDGGHLATSMVIAKDSSASPTEKNLKA